MQTLKLAILWHMHQPTYWDAQLGKYRYPWAFLHGARHYHMMAVLAGRHPEMRMTFNLTPVLLDQLDHYSGQSIKDALLEVVLRPASDLSEEELRRLLDHVFKLNLATMVDPFPRYRELRSLLSGPQGPSRLRRLKAQEIRDLQTLYLLTWCGAPLRAQDPVRALIEKEQDYTEEDKQAVFAAALEAVREIIPLCRRLQESGSIEISTTPYYHPILPLVIDSAAARESRHNVNLDEVDFRYRADAQWQVAAAVAAYRKRFGADPVGMWPAEGGVSDEALGLLADHGVAWAATDEGVLARTLQHGLSAWERYHPFRIRGKVLVYFRDRELSDRIGFVYSGWDPARAADDLVGRLHGIRDHLGGADGCVTIVLDGENPWEYYPDAGVGFLERLYQTVPRAPGLAPVRFRDHLQEARSGELGHIVPGSWIDANFDTWIGAPKKNHAWKVLAAARRKLAVEAPGVPVPEEFYRAEGSDWFWWLGPGHETPYEDSYENLFRLNLQAGLKAAGVEVPPILHLAAPVLPTPAFRPPMHLFTPKIDGRIGNYYDWIAAGSYRASEGSFHRINRRLSWLRFGFDAGSFYLRLEGDLELLRERGEATVRIEFQRPRPMKVVLSGGDSWLSNGQDVRSPFPGRAAVGAVVELAVPLETLGGRTGDAVEFAAAIHLGADSLDRLPQFGFVVQQIPPPDFGRENWSV